MIKKPNYLTFGRAVPGLNVNEISGVRRKFSWGGFGSGSDGGYLYLVCAVCDVTI